MRSFRVEHISLAAVVLAVVIIAASLNLFRATDRFIEHSFDHQRGNRHIIKVNLILQKGIAEAFAALQSKDGEAFLDAITTVESSAGYMNTLSGEIVRLAPNLRPDVMALVGKLEGIYDDYLDADLPVPVAELNAVERISNRIYQDLSDKDIVFYDRLNAGSRKIRDNTRYSFFLMTFLSLMLVALALLLRKTLGTKMKMASALHLAKEELEQRVRQRTEELAKTNLKLSHEIDDRIEVQKAIDSLVAWTIGATGQKCFDSIVEGLANWLEVDCVLLGEIVDDRKVKALSMIEDGRMVADFSYELQGTPCRTVSKNGYQVYPENIVDLFPADSVLSEFGAQSYVGIPVIDESRRPVGILCAVSRGKMVEKPSWKSTFQILASKAASEIARLHSERKRSEVQEQLVHTQRLEAIGTLAGGIAHDFNNILAAILGYSEILRVRLQPGTKEERANSEVLQAARRAKELVDQILAFSRKSDATTEVVKMHVVASEVLRLLRQTIPRTIDIRFVTHAENDTVLANSSQIHQILMNLCMNSAYAMKEAGGTLTVELENVAVDTGPDGSAPGLAQGRYVLLRVNDTGVGMTDAVAAKAFDPFFTTKGKSEGSGMGLAVVHGIVQNYGGQISLVSRPGQGTRAVVWLPLHEAYVEPVETAAAVAPRGRETIMVVDDEETLTDLLTAVLEDLGYSVRAYTSSRAALEAYTMAPHGYDLVISDQTMPDMAGTALVEQILDKKPGQPVLLCTGYSDGLNEQKAIDIGACGLLKKPIDHLALARAVRAALDQPGRLKSRSPGAP